MKRQKIECWNCGSYNVVTYRERWIWFSIHSLIASLAAVAFIVTIPFLFITIPVAVIAFVGAIFEKENKAICRKCKFKFKINSDGTHTPLETYNANRK